MKVVHTVKELRDALAAEKALQKTVGFVLTMGVLHKGHAY